MFLPNGEIAGLIDTGPAFKGAIVSQFRVTVTKTHHRTPAAIIALSFVYWFESVLTSRRRLFIAIGRFVPGFFGYAKRARVCWSAVVGDARSLSLFTSAAGQPSSSLA